MIGDNAVGIARQLKQSWLTVCQKLSVAFICLEFVWNIEEDFKPVPDTWIPAKDIEFSNGNPLPDENGHMPGTYDAAQVKLGKGVCELLK